MAQVIIPSRFRHRERTAASWASLNEVLLLGEWGYENDTGKLKIGDGTTGWNSLPYHGVWTLADVRRVLDLLGSTTTGDIIYKGASGWTRLPKGSDGQVLTLALGVPTWAAGGGGGGGGGVQTLLGTATVVGSAATALALSGIDLSAYRSLRAELSLDNATASAANLSLLYNTDTTPGNYNRQIHFAASTTNSASRGNDALFGAMTANETLTGEFRIRNDRDGRPRAWGHVNGGAPAAIEQRTFSHVWNSATNVTGITLSSSVANSLAVGSTMAVYGIS